MTLVFSFLIGFLAGLRSLTPPAATAWAVYLGWLKVEGPLSLIGSVPSVALFTLVAIVELGGQAAANTQPHLTARFGCADRHGWLDRRVHCCRRIARSSGRRYLGALGGVVGCFAGYRARAALGKSLNTPDT
jgi:uncharacterized membrane protein